MLKEMPIVEVEWVDSTRHGGWNSVESYNQGIDEDSLRCRSVGYLFRKDKRCVVLVLNQSQQGSLCDAMVIPRSAVKSLRTLDKPKREKGKSETA